MAVRVPPGVVSSPSRISIDEVTIDYPGTPYRAWAERHADLVAYWRLDEAAVTRAVDSQCRTRPGLCGRERPAVSGVSPGVCRRALRRRSRVGAHGRGRALRDVAGGSGVRVHHCGIRASAVSRRWRARRVDRGRGQQAIAHRRGRLHSLQDGHGNDDCAGRDNCRRYLASRRGRAPDRGP